MAKNRRGEISGAGEIRRWMQALALTAVLMAYPVSALWERAEAGVEVQEEVQAEVREEIQTEAQEEAQEGTSGVRPRVALTFDDGPSPEYTPLLLDGLREREVRASFFVIGSNIEKEGGEEIIRRMHEEGHLIGNHTWHHVDLSDLSTEDAWKELEMTDSLIKAVTGEETALVRPPFGEFPRSMEEPDKLYVKWTVDSRDWVTKDTQEIVRKVVTDTEENDIILMHDCYGTSVEAALQIIDILSERGYEFVTVDRLLLD